MKYAAIALLCACIVSGGFVYASGLKAKMRLCEHFLSFLNFAKSEVTFSGASVYEIVRKYVTLHPRQLPFLEHCQEPISASVQEKVRENKVLEQAQKEYILSFFAAFGKGDESASLNLIEHCMESFDAEYRRCQKESAEKAKLIRRLSLLAAAGAAIIFI
ncbi:MAG: hypothetical protein IJG23_03300 [Clostridia bacterium]|nr:hypothetical protein [Clostridia bacterium]